MKLVIATILATIALATIALADGAAVAAPQPEQCDVPESLLASDADLARVTA
jgi:hypothetical protein